MQNITTVLFDLGGTLAYVHPSQDWLYARACKEFGVDGNSEQLRKADEGGWDEYATPLGPAHPAISTDGETFARHKTVVLQERLRRSGIKGPLEAIAARILELDTEPEMYRVYDDAVPALEALRARNLRMAIISNHEWDLPALVAGLGLSDFFETVVTSARSGYRKPHPKIYEDAFAQMGIAPAEAVMIGDSPGPDIEGALRVGLQAVLIDRHGQHTSNQHPHIIRDLSPLPDLIAPQIAR